jgi:hypothetical protein
VSSKPRPFTNPDDFAGMTPELGSNVGMAKKFMQTVLVAEALAEL